MPDGSWELQKAVYDALSAALSVPVHSGAPQDAALPYVDIGETDALPDDVQGRDGAEETLTIHVWTVYGSQKPAKDIISAIHDALHAQRLVVDGRSAAFAHVTGRRLFADDDDVAWHGIVTLRINHYGPQEG